jgi:hypothetical protein
MAVKKATSRTRSTTKRAKTTRSKTAKRATKTKTAATPAPVEYTPTIAIKGPAQRTAPPAPIGEQPSRFTGDHYLHATGPQPEEGPARHPGKWVIFVSRGRIDALWAQIKRAVESGRLGHAAKVSTALPDPLSPNPKKHVVCVYTSNDDDPTDVRRVRDALRQLGVTWKIAYKSDATPPEQSEVMVAGPAAKYYE